MLQYTHAHSTFSLSLFSPFFPSMHSLLNSLPHIKRIKHISHDVPAARHQISLSTTRPGHWQSRRKSVQSTVQSRTQDTLEKTKRLARFIDE